MLGSRLDSDGLVPGIRMPELLMEVSSGESVRWNLGLPGEELRVERRGCVACHVISFFAAVWRRKESTVGSKSSEIRSESSD